MLEQHTTHHLLGQIVVAMPPIERAVLHEGKVNQPAKVAGSLRLRQHVESCQVILGKWPREKCRMQNQSLFALILRSYPVQYVGHDIGCHVDVSPLIAC